MPNQLELPDDLLPLIEKRDREDRRDRGDAPPNDPTDATPRKDERRQTGRRADDGGQDRGK